MAWYHHVLAARRRLKFWEKYSLLTLHSKYAGALTFQNFMSLGIETVSDKGSKQQREDITLSFQAYKQICREHLWSKFGLCHIIFFLRKQQFFTSHPSAGVSCACAPTPVCVHALAHANEQTPLHYELLVAVHARHVRDPSRRHKYAPFTMRCSHLLGFVRRTSTPGARLRPSAAQTPTRTGPAHTGARRAGVGKVAPGMKSVCVGQPNQVVTL